MLERDTDLGGLWRWCLGKKEKKNTQRMDFEKEKRKKVLAKMKKHTRYRVYRPTTSYKFP